MSVVKQFDSLSTSYVNLGALIRHLRDQDFNGSLRVVVNEYEAEVGLNGTAAPTVEETDPATGRASRIDGGMERLLVHAREPGGTITVYENPAASANPDQEPIEANTGSRAPKTTAASPFSAAFPPSPDPAAVPVNWAELLEAGGKLIGAVERAVESIGSDFDSSFRAARIQLGDDYPFLDPTAGGLTYANKKIILNQEPNSNAFVTAVSECLRRVVNKIAIGKESKRFRETVAIELAVAVRLRPNGLSHFAPHLDRIAGTRVL